MTEARKKPIVFVELDTRHNACLEPAGIIDSGALRFDSGRQEAQPANESETVSTR
jgi:hypothetical protein